MSKLTKGRVVLSTNFKETMDLAKRVYAKHQADGANSLLNNLDDADWDVSGPLIDSSIDLHNQAEDMARKAEQLYRQRDSRLATIKKALITSKATLKGRFINNPKKMAEWGFEIDDTPQLKKATVKQQLN